MPRDLYPHQIQALELMEQSPNGILADEMGLGKTCTAVSYLRLLEIKGVTSGHMLIVCPLAVLANWANEVNVIPGVRKAHIFHGNRRKMPSEPSIIITTFGLLKHLYPHYDAVIIDEVHVARNHRSKMYKHLCMLQSPRVWGLSGTPFNNSVHDLYAISNVCKLPHPYNDMAFWATVDDERMHEWRARFVIRRLKTDVLDLPSITETTVTVQPNDNERAAFHDLHNQTYRTFVQWQRAGFAEEHRDLGMKLIQLILRLRQAADAFCTIPDPVTGLYDLHLDEPEALYGGYSKVKAVIDSLEASPDKVVVFSSFTRTLKILEAVWGHRNPDSPTVTYDGSLNSAERERVLAEFRGNPNVKVIFISISSGNVGITLNEANTVYFVEPWFNPYAEQQAMERVHRIGQTRDVQVVHFRARAPVEEWVDLIRQSKRRVGDAVFNDSMGEDGGSYKLSQVRRLLDLIADYDKDYETPKKRRLEPEPPAAKVARVDPRTIAEILLDSDVEDMEN